MLMPTADIAEVAGAWQQPARWPNRFFSDEDWVFVSHPHHPFDTSRLAGQNESYLYVWHPLFSPQYPTPPEPGYRELIREDIPLERLERLVGVGAFDASNNRSRVLNVYFGPRYTEAVMHDHSPAINVLMEGVKMYIMMPPSRGASELQMSCTNALAGIDGSIENLRTWLVAQLPRLLAHNVTIFLQHAGDVVFVPGWWPHAVINLGFNAGITYSWFCSQTAGEAGGSSANSGAGDCDERLMAMTALSQDAALRKMNEFGETRNRDGPEV